MKSADVEDTFSYQYILKVSYPLIIGGVAQTIINVSDTIFLGRLSELALGASAIAGLYYVTFFMLGVGFSIGTQILIARFDGEQKYAQIGKVFSHSAVFMGLLAILLFLIMYLGSPYILFKLIKSTEVLNASLAFIRYRSFSIFFGFFVLLSRSFFAGISITRMIGFTTFISATFNIIFNYLLVFGNFGFPKMGITGSGLASTLAEACAAIYCIFYIYKFGNIKKYELLHKFTYTHSLFMQLLKTAAPLMLQVFIALWSWFVFFLIVEKMGEHELAISNLTRNVYMILMLCLMGFSNATNTLVSNLLGQKRNHELFIVLKKIVLLSLGSTLIVVLINLIFAQQSLGIFTNSATLINDSMGCIYVISGSCLMFSVAYILLSAVSGTGNTLATLLIETVTLVFYLFSTYLFAVKYKTSIEIVWCTEFVYFICMGFLSYWYLRRFRVERVKIR